MLTRCDVSHILSWSSRWAWDIPRLMSTKCHVVFTWENITTKSKLDLLLFGHNTHIKEQIKQHLLKCPFTSYIFFYGEISPQSVLDCLSQLCWHPERPAHCLTEWKCWNQLHHYVCLCPSKEAKFGFWQPEVVECVCVCVCADVHVYVWPLQQSFDSIRGYVLFSLSGVMLHNIITMKRTELLHSTLYIC